MWSVAFALSSCCRNNSGLCSDHLSARLMSFSKHQGLKFEILLICFVEQHTSCTSSALILSGPSWCRSEGTGRAQRQKEYWSSAIKGELIMNTGIDWRSESWKNYMDLWQLPCKASSKCFRRYAGFPHTLTMLTHKKLMCQSEDDRQLWCHFSFKTSSLNKQYMK